MSINELRERRKKLSEQSEKIFNNMNIISNESGRVTEVARNSHEILENLNFEFEKQTGFDSNDIKFLFTATALQMTRWILISKLNKIADEKVKNYRVKDNDYRIKNMEHEKCYKFKQKHHKRWEETKSEKYRTWSEIVYEGVPYDINIGSPMFGVNMEGGNHRVHTLGHDPVLGWIFGTINILSDTITLDDFRTYKISSKPKHWESQSNIIEALMIAIESVKEDYKRLPAAIFAQGIHMKSDILTKKGLPVPIMEIFSQELAGKLYKSGYDSLYLMKDINIVGVEAVVAIFINMIITLIHGLYYDSNKYTNREIYEVKTRKIIMYSNLIATSSNLLYVGSNITCRKKAVIENLDIGGLIVTIHRLINDMNFIMEIKKEFIFGNFNRLIQGDELQLEKVDLKDLVKYKGV